MQTWVVSDSDTLSQSFCDALVQLHDCNWNPQFVQPAAAKHLATLGEGDADVVFFLAPSIGRPELEQIHDLRSLISGDLIVVSSAKDKETLLNVIRSGATDFLDLQGDVAGELRACWSRIQEQRDRQDRKSQMMAIVPCHVSSDASILATNMSAVIAKYSGSCCLLDFQLRGGDAAMLLKLQPEHSLFDLASQSQPIDATMFAQALAGHETGIQLLAGPALFSDLRGIDATACNSIVDLARSSFSRVVVATEDIQHSEQMYTLVNSDEVILTMRPDLLSLHRAKLHLDFIGRLNVPGARVHIVVFCTGAPGELPRSAISKVFSSTQIHFVPVDPGEITVSINVGNPIVVESPRSKTALAIVELTKALMGFNQAKPDKRTNYLTAAKTAAALAISTLQLGK